MWKFLPGVSKSESKRKADTRESNKAYDATKKKRTFQPHWLQMYKWLHFDRESQLMSCDCQCKNLGNTLFWHNICTSHTFKTYSECRILHVIIKKISRGGMPPNPPSRFGSLCDPHSKYRSRHFPSGRE